MSSIKKYLLSFAFLSFAFLGSVYADNDENLVINLHRNSSYTISADRFIGLSCPEIRKVGSHIVKNGNDYVVNWNEENSDRASGTDYYNCRFNYLAGSSASSRTGSRQLNVTINYGTIISEYFVNIQLYKHYYETRNLINDDVLGGVSLLTDFAEIISVEQGSGSRYETGNPYVSINCPTGTTTTCIVSLRDTLPTDSSVRWARYKIKYKTTHGEEKIAKVDMAIYSQNTVFAYPGSYGTCGFGSDWARRDNHYEHELRGDYINLPDCTSENSANPLITFRGWVNYGSFDTDNPAYRKLDTCQSYVVTSGGSFRHDPDKNIYFGCYVRTGGIILFANGGELPRDSSYIERDGAIFVKKEGSVVLPEPTEIPGMYNIYGTGRFEGWEDTSGNIYPAGTTVAANGERYMALYSTGQTVSGEDVNQKMVFVNETSPYILNSTTITSCSSTDSSKVVANMSGGECFLTGVSATNGEYVDVIVTTSSSTRTLKVRVVSRDGQYGDDWSTIVIEENNNANIEAQNGHYENVAGANVCDTYSVSSDGRAVTGFATRNGFGLNVTKYKAVSSCDGNSYLALCMDPGRPGPNSSDTYKLDETFTTSNDFGKLVTHIVQKFVNEGENNTTIAAANIALRIVEYYSPEELASGNNGGNAYLANALEAYRAMGQHLNSVCPDLSGCSASEIENALSGASWSWNNAEIKSLVAQYLAGFSSTAGADEINEIKNEADRTSSFDPANDFLYHVEYKGKLTFPDGMTATPADITADCGSIPGVFNCNLNGSFVSSSVYEYTFTYSIDLSNSSFEIPRTNSENSPSIKVTSSTGVTSANVFVIKTINDNKQRMVIFNTDDVDLKVIMPIYVVCDINKAPFIIGGPGFRDDLFKAAGCCQFITDETSTEFVTYCTADCIQSNFASMCNPNYTVGGTSGVDVYTINEAYKANASGSKELNYACIVDVSGASSAIDNTNNYADAVGNFYALMSYNDNQYCTVSCKEDWDISTSSFENFIAENAVAAGTYFAIHKDLFIGGSRTCVTTYIDYELYRNQVTNLSRELVEAWNKHSEYTQVYSVLEDSATYTDETYEIYEIVDTEECGTEEEPETCYVWGVSETKTCRVHKISTNSGGQYNRADWNGQYANNGGMVGISTGSLGGAAGGGREIHTDWDAGSMPGPHDSSCDTCGYCEDYQDDEYLLNVVTYKGSNVKNTIDSSKATVNAKREDIRDKAIDMTSCQNFVLKNTSSPEKNEFNYDDNSTRPKTYRGTASITGFVNSSRSVVVDTKFEPSGVYDYEEREFMSLLGRDNVIENHMEENENLLEDYGYSFDSFNGNCVETDRTNAAGERVKLCRNKLTTQGFNPGSPWAVGSNDAKTYGGDGGNNLESAALDSFKITICDTFDGYEYTSHGDCDWSQGDVYYYRVNYIKQELENSSFYRNKGIWAGNKINDVKQHADTLDDAYGKFRGIDESKITLYGLIDNTFPVGMVTPRNIYQYSYTFADVGYFSDGTTGRIMGNASQSLIAINKHACFYEVYEKICRCCGDPMLWTTYSGSKLTETSEFLTTQGYVFTPSGTGIDPNTTFSRRLAYVGSSVSLYDLDGSNDRELASNWSTNDNFLYATNNHVGNAETDKGANLASSIVKRGEEIYDTGTYNPEYSYVLSPSTLSLIREYNEGRLYGYGSDSLILYGVSNREVAFDNSITNITQDIKEENNTFSHFGSKFLEDFMKTYVPSQFEDRVLPSRKTQGPTVVCSVDGTLGVTAADRAFDMVQNNNCRWVDYVQTTPDGKQIRLAFK